MLVFQTVAFLIAGGFLWHFYGFPLAFLVLFIWACVHLTIGTLYVRWIRYRPNSIFRDKIIATSILDMIEMLDHGGRNWEDCDENWTLILICWPVAFIAHLLFLIAHPFKTLTSFLMSLSRKKNLTI